jgi:hypothetical protein
LLSPSVYSDQSSLYKNTHFWTGGLKSAEDVSTLFTDALPLLADFPRGSKTITAADPVAFVVAVFADALEELAAGVLLAAT